MVIVNLYHGELKLIYLDSESQSKHLDIICFLNIYQYILPNIYFIDLPVLLKFVLVLEMTYPPSSYLYILLYVVEQKEISFPKTVENIL